MIREKENRLFEEWKKEIDESSGAFFVTDGIVDAKSWNKCKVKVLYLLKEVNGADSQWDERDYLLRYNTEPNYIKTHSPTIDALIKWQYGIRTVDELTWGEIQTATDNINMQNELLSEIGLVNIKKTAGGSVVDWTNFDTYFKKHKNREYLKNQLSLYKPDIVICGGTAWALCDLYGWDFSLWKETSRGIKYLKHEGVIYVDYCHPNIRAPRNVICFALVDAVKELLNKEI